MADSPRNPDVERRINDHLEAIDTALAAKGVPLTERRSVTGDVAAQIGDMLAEKSGGNPTSADVAAVLRKLDAPESYAKDTQVAPLIQSRAPGWTVRCRKCGFTEPWGKYGIRLLASGTAYTIGWCSRCRWLRIHAIEKKRETE